MWAARLSQREETHNAYESEDDRQPLESPVKRRENEQQPNRSEQSGTMMHESQEVSLSNL